MCVETRDSNFGSRLDNGFQGLYKTETKKDCRGYDVTTDNRGKRLSVKPTGEVIVCVNDRNCLQYEFQSLEAYLLGCRRIEKKPFDMLVNIKAKN